MKPANIFSAGYSKEGEKWHKHYGGKPKPESTDADEAEN